MVQADQLVGGSDAVLVIDDTAIPKKGTHSVGVAAQYASALGKTANCQTLVSLTLARGEVPVMLALRLFLPESWTSNRARLQRAGVPAEYRAARTKPELALTEIDRATAAGVRFGCVLADAGYGMSALFGRRLQLVSLPGRLVFRATLRYTLPTYRWSCRSLGGAVPASARPRRSSIAAERSGRRQMARHQLAHRHERKAQGAFRCSACAGHEPAQRIKDKGQQHPPGDEAWLIGEHRMSGEKKYYLANLSAKTDLRTFAATIKARWICEQAHQQLKEELGLDHSRDDLGKACTVMRS